MSETLRLLLLGLPGIVGNWDDVDPMVLVWGLVKWLLFVCGAPVLLLVYQSAATRNIRRVLPRV